MPSFSLPRCAIALGCSLVILALTTRPTPAAERTVTFRNDVMAVLSKAGCNMGICHGNQNGKNGFKLSLRGDDPAHDFQELSRDQLARRTNSFDPDASLILRKATAQIAHEGGRRFSRDSEEYRILRDWIAQGLPPDPTDLPQLERLEVDWQAVKGQGGTRRGDRVRVIFDPEHVQVFVKARFSDGTTRDVTDLAVYETSNQMLSVSHGGRVEAEKHGEAVVLVRFLNKHVPVPLAFIPPRPDYQWNEVPANNEIDKLVFQKLRQLRMNPSPLSDDHVFLRRAYLDLLGILPTVDEARAFLDDGRKDKRSRLIDALLKRPEFADHWALKWSDLLKNEEKTLDRKGVQAFHQWIRQSFADNKPLDQFARELISATGSTYQNPPSNFYRANREPKVRGEAVAQVFLGLRLQCAKCHNHPFDRWTQDDYYNWASFFARVQYKILENKRRDKNDKHEFDGEQIVWLDRESEVTNPRTGGPARPHYLADGPAQVESQQSRLEAVAGWITSPRNAYFARMQANRIWYQLMGRGIVDPIDDVRATNLPVNEPLLDWLAKDFVEHGFDLRHTIRTIMNSRTYQLASVPEETNQDDEINFSHAVVRPLTAEQLLDSLTQVMGVPVKFNGYPLGMRAGQLPGVFAVRPRDKAPSDGDQFLRMFGKPPRLLTCECERSTDPTLAQTFQMISGPAVNRMLMASDNRLQSLLDSGQSDAEIIEDLYLSALCRFPSDAERGKTVAYLKNSDDRRQALEDIAWGIINAKEFLLRK